MLTHSALIRRFATISLLAVYGSVGILGYGLHELFHVHHHHASTGDQRPLLEKLESHLASPSCSHGCSCHEHGQVPVAPSDGQQHISGVDAPCALCELLTQAQQPVYVVCVDLGIEQVPAAPVAEVELTLSKLPQLHLARGPPLA